MTKFMIKKVESNDIGQSRIYHITTVNKSYDWEDFFNEYSGEIMDLAVAKGCDANGKYIVIPVTKMLMVRGKRKITKGKFNAPIFEVWL